ncbi:MAG: hypothetical protein IJJ01_07540 [Firmicutes bacterium]|nr:hypothetical protein [Bacillota bacterium]
MNEYAKELGEVLKTFDVQKLRHFILEHWDMYRHLTAPELINDDSWLKGCMAKMILARIDMPDDLREKAKEVLDELGWDYEIY